MPCGRWRWTLCSAPIPVIPACPWAWRTSPRLLYSDYLNVAPRHPHWVDRDRLVLSNGHGSMLLYAAAHLAGYPLDREQLMALPATGLTYRRPPGAECGVRCGDHNRSTGQGLANAVGMALSERLLAAEFNRPKHEIVNHRTWVLLGDGCLMEGISHEACSLAGVLRLGKLICIYDDNGISIDGEVRGWFRDDTPARFEAYGWHVVRDVDGHDAQALRPRAGSGLRRPQPSQPGMRPDHHRIRRPQQAGDRRYPTAHRWARRRLRPRARN